MAHESKCDANGLVRRLFADLVEQKPGIRIAKRGNISEA